MLLLALLMACDPGADGPQALAFDGAPDCATADLDDTPPTSFTVELWLRGDPEAIDDARPLVLWKDVFELAERDDGQPVFTVGPDDVGASYAFSLMDGVLHHVAGTYDGGDGTVRLFLDGAQVGVRSAAAFIGEEPDYRIQVGCAKAATEGFYGVLDELRISSTVRYTDDFDVPTAAFKHDADTFLLYHLDEGTGTEAMNVGADHPMVLTDTSWVSFDLGDEG